MTANIIGCTMVIQKPKGSQFCLINPDGSPALFYRIRAEKYNDGTIEPVLEYFSSFGLWQGSNERDQAKFLNQPKFFSMETIFETGASTHEINDLILFADNTRELADVRDEIYMQGVKPADNDILKSHLSGFFGSGEVSGYSGSIEDRVRVILQKRFNRLLYDAIDAYKKEFPDHHYTKESLSYDQKEEFCKLYADDFSNWKREHGFMTNYLR